MNCLRLKSVSFRALILGVVQSFIVGCKILGDTSVITVKDLASSEPAPVAEAATISLDQDTTYTSDGSLYPHLTGEGDAASLACTKYTNPSHGVAVVNADCSYTYTPTSGYSGSDSFTFIVIDLNGVSNPAQVSITVNAPAYTLPDVASGLVFLEFNNNANDSLAGGRNFDVSGGVTYVPNGRGSRTTVALNGTTGYLSFDMITHGQIFNPSTSNFSISFWFSTNDTGVQTLIHEKYTVQVRDYLKVFLTNGTLTAAYSTDFQGGNNEVILNSTSTNLNNGLWHHVVFVRDNTRTGKLYIDNVLQAEDTNNAGSANGIGPINTELFVGRSTDNTEYFQGQLSQFYWVNGVVFDATKVNIMYNLP